MTEFATLSVRIEPDNIREMMRQQIPVEELARELHDVVFSFGKPIPTFEACQPETQEWFRGRARMLIDSLLGGSE